MSSDVEDALGGLFMAALGAGIVLLGVLLIQSAVRIADARRCDGALQGGCIATERARVTARDEWGVTVVFDDGRQTADLTVDDAPVAVGSRVLLERWRQPLNDDLVAMVDARTGRRYRTDAWPDLGGGIVIAVFGFWPLAGAAAIWLEVAAARKARGSGGEAPEAGQDT